METLKQETTATVTEIVNLTPIEKDLYQKCLSRIPDMTIMTWKKIREDALGNKDKGAKTFYECNNFLVADMPDEDERKEFKGNIN
ncbi:MAG: hypothetical protein NTV03_00870 [Candidatus Nomurabacteria bacterium]|nr:hypothetical protein [Candidatus Nomurabacteria bacterium]